MASSVSDRFVHAMGEIERLLPQLTSEHPEFYETYRMREMAFNALADGIAAALRVCDMAEGMKLRRERTAARTIPE
jgi:hypothetical protein